MRQVLTLYTFPGVTQYNIYIYIVNNSYNVVYKQYLCQ